MKKVMYFMGCALFVAAMAVACGSKDEKKDDKNAQQTEQKGDEQKAPEQNNTVQAGAPETDPTIGENAQGTGEKVANELINAAGDKAIQEGKDLINNL